VLHSNRQTKASFHAELYDLIPDSHLLRKINDLVDFGFVHSLVEDSYCLYYGRPANEPELLFRLLFIQFLYDLSDERVTQEAQVNLAYKWFIGLNPEDALPDSSQLSRFRNHRLGANRVEQVLFELVRQCVDQGLVKSKVLLIDSTHTFASVQKKDALDVLKDAAKRLHRAVTKKHPKLDKRLPKIPKPTGEREDQEKAMLHYLANLGEVVEELLPDTEGAIREKLDFAKRIIEDERLLARKGIMSAIDPDARFGWKSSTKSFFGYKEHIAMTEEEIITAIEVTGGSSDKATPPLVGEHTSNRNKNRRSPRGHRLLWKHQSQTIAGAKHRSDNPVKFVCLLFP
jgi:transposase